MNQGNRQVSRQPMNDPMTATPTNRLQLLTATRGTLVANVERVRGQARTVRRLSCSFCLVFIECNDAYVNGMEGIKRAIIKKPFNKEDQRQERGALKTVHQGAGQSTAVSSHLFSFSFHMFSLMNIIIIFRMIIGKVPLASS
jgi:hypothetical protein